MSPKAGKVVFVLTSHDKFPNGKPTGWFLPEAAHPYYVLSPSFDVVWASPKGGEAPLDPISIDMFREDAKSQQFLGDEVAQAGVKNTVKLSDVLANEKEYKGIFYIGGHGPMFDLATDKENIALAEAFYQSGRPVGAVCHGPAALVNVKGKDGKSIFDGRKVAAFSNNEEEMIQLTDQVPFLLESKVVELGANYTLNAPWQGCVEVDGNVVTGANPASGTQLAEEMLKLLQA